MDISSGINTVVTQCKPYYNKAESVIHTWGHITRTAQGAAWIVKIMGGTPRQQELAYLAGILHDIVRPPTEIKCHAKASAEKALTILEEVLITNSEKEEIYNAIKDHRTPVPWNNAVHSSVYISDKIFEHMGAYLDFRASVWAGELSHTDFEGFTPVESIIQYYKKASEKFLTGKFPDCVTGIVEYQTQWNKTYFKALQDNEWWAVDMAGKLFLTGKNKKDFEKVLHTVEPEGKQTQWVNEMRTYITGKKFPFFYTLL
ncbi:MAG: HD domain-containing protein [Candidatus Methanofastidiosia archaeon]|jgi:HD superfamily phosphohydrolase YqeK